jgi:ArsR family transcriptional regulator, arsenate/arsenite/antimonite-responsive transcriptional repressor
MVMMWCLLAALPVDALVSTSVDDVQPAPNIDGCQWRSSVVPIPTRTLPVIPVQPQAEECCAPLQAALLPPQEASALSRRFAALGDPVRLRLLNLLATSSDGAVCACDLVEPVGKSQSTVSHHLKVLREAGLVISERRGTNIWYAAVPAALDALREALAPVR